MRLDKSLTLSLLLIGLLPFGGASVSGQEWRTVTLSQQRAAETPLNVRVQYMAGRFQFEPGDGSELYRMQLRYDTDRYDPVSELENDRLELGVSRRAGVNLSAKESDEGRLSLALTRSLPISLDLDFGAVHADIELGGMSLTGLEVNTGASEAVVAVSNPNPILMESAEFHVGVAEFTARYLGNLNAERIEVSAGVGEVTLDLTGSWRQNASVAVDMKLGDLEIILPRGVGVRLEDGRSFLASLDVDDMIARGDSYYSRDWDSANRRITIDVQAAFGTVDVVWSR